MINEGEFVVCKKYYKLREEEPFLPGVSYEIRSCHIDNGIISVYTFKDRPGPVLAQYDYFRLNKNIGQHKYFYDYFYTTAEWRDKQIDLILEDD